ncbi:hypothetical protein QTO17_35785, partial [Vibrio owensii]
LIQLVILGLIISALNVGNVLVLDTLWHHAEFNNLVLFLLLGIGAYLLTIVESYLGEKLGRSFTCGRVLVGKCLGWLLGFSRCLWR